MSTMQEKISFHGRPCWYELGTSDLAGAGDFYGRLFGWRIEDSGMQGFTYHLAWSGDDAVAGLMSNVGQAGDPPPNWVTYFAVDDCDRSVAEIRAAGGRVLQEPGDIPGTGRFAIVTDPQGAVFGLMQPDLGQLSDEERAKALSGTGGAFDQEKPGHGQWNELMSSDPQAGLAFYSSLLRWDKGEAMDMGEMGTYQLLRYKDANIGAVMGLGKSPVPAWLPYFGVGTSVAEKTGEIRRLGGTVHFGPAEVPGPTYIAVAQDPQGAWFAMIGRVA